MLDSRDTLNNVVKNLGDKEGFLLEFYETRNFNLDKYQELISDLTKLKEIRERNEKGFWNHSDCSHKSFISDAIRTVYLLSGIQSDIRFLKQKINIDNGNLHDKIEGLVHLLMELFRSSEFELQ